MLKFLQLFLLVALVPAPAAPAPAPAPIDYTRDIRPILAENCFYCHGQDATKREAKLRLDTHEGQLANEVVVPGKPNESELIARILSNEEDEQMPPADSHRVLTAAQKDTLRRWVAEGAPFTPLDVLRPHATEPARRSRRKVD
jgi:mono/diheme cytochrome c family protein